MDNLIVAHPGGPTGPRTTDGKAIVSRNALKHGGYSEAVLVLGEDPAAYQAILNGMVESLLPVGPLEVELVDRIAQVWWRLQRVGRAEREGLKAALESELRRTQTQQVANPTHVAFILSMMMGDGRQTERLQRYEAQLERSFFRLLHELERIQAQRQGMPSTPPVIVEVNVNQG